MSKAFAIIFTGAGTATVGVGGVYLVKGSLWGGKDSEDNQTTTPPSQPDSTTTQEPAKLAADLGFTDLSGFKNNKGGECVKKYFGENLDFSQGETIENADDKKLKSSDFSVDTTGESSNNPGSCLIVNWEKTGSSSEESTDSKWKGAFRWLWAFSKGNKGLVLFVTTKEPITTSQQLDLDGGIYFIEKEGSGTTGNWAVKKKKELTNDSKKIDNTEFSNVFPEKGDVINNLTTLSNKENWGFVKDANELEKVCKPDEDSSTECPSDSSNKKEFKGSWLWTNGGGSHGADKWTKNLESKISSLFGSEYVDLNGAFGSLTGSWNAENLTSPQTDSTSGSGDQ